MVNKDEKEQYRKIVRRVLKAMDYKNPTHGDFRLWDGFIDWRATDKLLDKPPFRTALCHILDKHGNIVKADGKPVVVARDIVASTETEATEILKKSSLKFLEWWPSDPAKCQDTGENMQEIHNNDNKDEATCNDYRSRVVAAARGFFDKRKRSKKVSKERLLF